MKAAKKHGVTVSLDTNYRSKLWSIEKASRVIGELMRYTDICITNPGDIKDLFGIVSDKADFDLKKPDNGGAASVAEKLMKRYPLKGAALTLRTNLSASDNDFGAMLCGFCVRRRKQRAILTALQYLRLKALSRETAPAGCRDKN